MREGAFTVSSDLVDKEESMVGSVGHIDTMLLLIYGAFAVISLFDHFESECAVCKSFRMV